MTEITKEHLECRIEDWKSRVSNLYSLITQWLGDYRNVTTKQTSKVSMYEELMKKFDIPKTDLPVLDIYKDSKLVATIKPVGLWVIGANGRLDILTKTGSFILVDTAEKFQVPDWQVYSPTNRKKGEMLEQKLLRELVVTL